MLFVLAVLLVLLLESIIGFQNRLAANPLYQPEQDTFLQVMKWALANIYLAIVVAYLCLFVLLMAMIKRSYKQVYEQVKCKVILLFSGLIFVMAFRWFYYLCLQFNWIGFNLEDLLNEVPFYVSELLISTAYIVFLSKVYDSSEEPVARRKSS